MNEKAGGKDAEKKPQDATKNQIKPAEPADEKKVNSGEAKQK